MTRISVSQQTIVVQKVEVKVKLVTFKSEHEAKSGKRTNIEKEVNKRFSRNS